MTIKELIAFEKGIADLFRQGLIRAPIHLSGGNERQLIEIFQKIMPFDWVLCGWRSHYHCLLKGVPPDVLTAKIIAGHSVALCFPEQKILCSGIVGGIAPIAVGIAWALKRQADADPTGTSGGRVWCFIGDMTAKSGIVYEAMTYAGGHDLSVSWIVEDNGKSVCTDTQASWGLGSDLDVARYCYGLPHPHSGIGEWVQFQANTIAPFAPQ